MSPGWTRGAGSPEELRVSRMDRRGWEPGGALCLQDGASQGWRLYPILRPHQPARVSSTRGLCWDLSAAQVMQTPRIEVTGAPAVLIQSTL